MKARFQFSFISIGQINKGNTLTDFSLGMDPPSLQRSIGQIGMTHPIALSKDSENLHIVCGHRRVRAAQALGLEKLPANLLPASITNEAKLFFSLNENNRKYSDSETAVILHKLNFVGVSEKRIIEQYMPMLGLERSKKLLRDFLETRKFSDSFIRLLHNLNIPLRVYKSMFLWDDDSREQAEKVFAALRPGVNKLRELVELLDETSRRDGASPGTILDRKELRSILQSTEPKYDNIFEILYRWRFPTLQGLKKKVWLALDKLDLDPKTKVRTSENFENGEIKVELAFKTRDELTIQLEQLFKASHSQAMQDLIRVFKKPEH